MVISSNGFKEKQLPKEVRSHPAVTWHRAAENFAQHFCFPETVSLADLTRVWSSVKVSQILLWRGPQKKNCFTVPIFTVCACTRVLNSRDASSIARVRSRSFSARFKAEISISDHPTSSREDMNIPSTS